MSASLRALRHWCRGGLNPFGPVLLFDLVRSARRPRFVVARTLYALLIALALGWLFVTSSARHQGEVPAHQMTRFAGNFFYTFLAIQFGVMVLLTPAYTAGAIAEEKERKTLEFLLATDLSSREIVLGKLTARLLNLGLLLLAGLPVLSFLQFLGGVDVGIMLAATAATALTVFSVAGLSVLNSVLCRRARDAIILSYVVVIAYSLLGCAAWLGMVALTRPDRWPGLADFPSADGRTSPVTLGDVIDGFNAGNIPCAALQVWHGAKASAVFQQDLPGKLGRYAAFHVGVGLACLAWGMLRLRTGALREAAKSSRNVGVLGWLLRRPSVGRFPMIWKEVFVEGGLRLNKPGRIVLGLLFLASFLPVLFHLWAYRSGGYYGGWERLTRHVNGAQVRGVGTALATLMLLAVVVRAAGSVRSERERNTFDELLTTPLSNREILLGKWLGAMLSVRWGWAWLGLIWVVGLATDSVQFYGLAVIAGCWLVYAAVGAGVGLWFSLGSTSTLRATLSALAAMIFLCGGHWLLTELLCYLPLRRWAPHFDQEWLRHLEMGQTPPFVLGLLAYHRHDMQYEYQTERFLKMLPALLSGVACWAGLVPVLWVLVRRRFERMTGRVLSRPGEPFKGPAASSLRRRASSVPTRAC
jgi:ABC-type transport system involved in multi-copper enzyme maturation permease subunit